MTNWKEPEVWVPVAVVTGFLGLLGYAAYEYAHDEKEPVRVVEQPRVVAPVSVAPMAPGASSATPVVVVQQPQQQQREESHFFENWLMWRAITGSNDTHTHTREVHHVHHPAPVAPATPAVYNPPAQQHQHHGFVSTPASSKPAAAPAKPVFTPVKSAPSAIKTTNSPARPMSSGSFRSSSPSRGFSSGGKR